MPHSESISPDGSRGAAESTFHRSAIRCLRLAALLLSLSVAGGGWAAEALPRFDFTRAAAVREWSPAHDVGELEATPGGMRIPITGSDPYIHGPARNYPAGQPLWLRVRLRSDQPGVAQVFYFRTNPTEESSVRFPVSGGDWEETAVPIPPFGPGFRLRFDPPGTSGECILASISFESRVRLTEPAWAVPPRPVMTGRTLSLQSGDLKIVHNTSQAGGFELKVAGETMAAGWTRPRIGYLLDGKARWIDLSKAAVMARKEGAVLAVTASIRDPDGATWTLRTTFQPPDSRGALKATVRVTASRDRSVVFLPVLVLLPGAGSFGERKGQGLLAGVEYLDDEPSSSTADIEGPGANRRVTDTAKITFPFMAISARDRYIGLLWNPDPNLCALFDSPDRVFRSGGHAMGLLFPGSDGVNREEGAMLPYGGVTIRANQPWVATATILGGRGKSVIPAIRRAVAFLGLPSVREILPDRGGYVEQAAAGWLDSGIRDGRRYRHAYPGNFQPAPAADAAVFMKWLAGRTGDGGLKRRLNDAASQAVELIGAPDLNTASVSHVTYPVASLVFNEAAAGAARAREAGRANLGGFRPDGTIQYAPSPGGTDYGRTHFSREANGLTASSVKAVLEAALQSGDPTLRAEGLRVLRALDKFDDTVPRGAQTWEVPLHTPDILASAHLVRAYTIGYEMTGERRYLDRAIDWAWTGVPFIYLVRPTEKPVGLYATTPVLGATNWVAPNWIGLPVQWCGLVYGDAVFRMARHDPEGPWKTLANGIAASGVEQSWPKYDPSDPKGGGDRERQGLLPDSFHLRGQIRNDVAINPGTVQANAVRLFDGPALYDMRVFREAGAWVHAPGTIANVKEEAGRVEFRVDAWPEEPYQVLVVGLKARPRVTIDGVVTALAGGHRYDAAEGRLVLQLRGRPTVVLQTR